MSAVLFWWFALLFGGVGILYLIWIYDCIVRWFEHNSIVIMGKE
jgi:lipid-A-disaccharide synthase-like uncharacterized protein